MMAMRIALLAVTALGLSGCLIEDSYDDDGYYGGGGGTGWGSGWGGGGGNSGYGCETDAECGGLTCTRNGECLSAGLVREVRTIWTIDGEAASVPACMNAPKLSITFTSSTGEEFGYTPVPCEAGKFTVDKFPTRFTGVSLSRAHERGGAYGAFASDGTATLDLPY